MDIKLNSINSSSNSNSIYSVSATNHDANHLTSSNRDAMTQNQTTSSTITNINSNLNQHINTLNQQLNKASYNVEFDTNSGSKPGWLNIVDQTTHKVVFRIPPENIRHLIENQNNPSGIALDHHV